MQAINLNQAKGGAETAVAFFISLVSAVLGKPVLDRTVVRSSNPDTASGRIERCLLRPSATPRLPTEASGRHVTGRLYDGYVLQRRRRSRATRFTAVASSTPAVEEACREPSPEPLSNGYLSRRRRLIAA